MVYDVIKAWCDQGRGNMAEQCIKGITKTLPFPSRRRIKISEGGLWHLKLLSKPTSRWWGRIFVQVTDDILEALTNVQTLRSISIGYSCKCTVKGVLSLAQLSSLQTLQVMGHSTTDFGQLTGQDLQQLQQLSSLSIGVVPAEALKVTPPPPATQRKKWIPLTPPLSLPLSLPLGASTFHTYLIT